jgi:hypothetical protein
MRFPWKASVRGASDGINRLHDFLFGFALWNPAFHTLPPGWWLVDWDTI